MLPKAVIFAYRDQSFHLFVGQSDFFSGPYVPSPRPSSTNEVLIGKGCALTLNLFFLS